MQAKQGQLGPIQTNEELTSGKRENVDMGAISSNLMIHRFCSLNNLCLIFGAPFRENRVVFSLLVENIRVHCQSNHISQAASTASNVLLCRTT